MSSGRTVEESRRTAGRALRNWSAIVLLAVPLLLAGCAGIKGIELDSSNSRVCEHNTGICGVSDADNISFIISGQGTCGRIGVKWGDGDEETFDGNFAATASRRYFYVSHRYTERFPPEPRAWPGAKTVHAYSAVNCTGEAKVRVNVLLREVDAAGIPSFQSTLSVGLHQPMATACGVPSNIRPVRAGSTVSISKIPGSPTINFGCIFGGCVNDMDGNAGATNPAFPFPAMRRHSLVLRIVGPGGTQVVQGSSHASFVVQQDGPLEFCVNDDVLADNTGDWGIAVSVDETTIP